MNMPLRALGALGFSLAAGAPALSLTVEELPKPDYDESKVPAYTLPDPLVMNNGDKVATADAWKGKRRGEILELFREHVYGRSPGKPADLSFEPFESSDDALDGIARRRQVHVYFTADRAGGPKMDLLMYLPRRVKGPVPVFLLLNFQGNHSINVDPAVPLSKSWMADWREGIVDHRATEATRGVASSRFPFKAILERGYGVATAYYGDIDPDFDDGFKNGVHGAFDRFPDGRRPGDAWGAIGAWAWGLSRAMDYLVTDQEIDAKRVAVMGHSRLGKTALWAGAQDERFAIVISNNSGCGGAALSKRHFGETVQAINVRFPHWFCGNFTKYDENEAVLPLDQHMLIALSVPRPVYVASAEDDRWADPKGEFLAARAASPVYELFGKEGLPADQMPGLNHPVAGTIGYHYRTGKHDVTAYDWQRYMDFADRHYGRGGGR